MREEDPRTTDDRINDSIQPETGLYSINSNNETADHHDDVLSNKDLKPVSSSTSPLNDTDEMIWVTTRAQESQSQPSAKHDDTSPEVSDNGSPSPESSEQITNNDNDHKGNTTPDEDHNHAPEHARHSNRPKQAHKIWNQLKTAWSHRPQWSYGAYAAITIIILLFSVLMQAWSTNTDAPYDPAKGLIGQVWAASYWAITDTSGLFNLIPLTIVYAILVTVVNRYWLGTGLSLSASYALAIANKCKITARNETIIPSDLSFVTGGGGAGNVTSFLEGSLGTLVRRGVKGIIVILIVFILLQLIDKRSCFIPCSWRRFGKNLKTTIWDCIRIIVPIITVISLIGWSYALCDTNSKLYKTMAKEYGYSPMPWNTLEDAKAWGTLTTFGGLTHVKAMDEPADYSQETMRKIYAKYKGMADEINATRDTELTDSTVIMVLSETFSDPNRLPGVGFDKDVIPLTHETQSTTTAGTMLSPGYGGGTANIEFQEITGLSMTNFNPSLLSPHQQLVPRLKSVYTFNRAWNDANDCGTTCSIAIHPYYKNFYLRDSNYKKFGFSSFSSLDSVPPVTHQGKIDRNDHVSDAAAYQETLDAIRKDPERSKFIQLITMQNHMPYVPGEYDGNEFVDLDRTTALNDEEKGQLESYAKGVSITDASTRDFLNQLDGINKPITVVFYGDHLPGVYGSLTNDKANELALHETDYFIWSNTASKSHAVKLDPVKNAYSSSNYFMAQAAEHMNSRVSPYLAMLTHLHDVAPATTRLAQTLGEWKNSDTVTVLGDDGKVIPNDKLGEDVKTSMRDYALIQYDMTIGAHWLDGIEFTKTS